MPISKDQIKIIHTLISKIPVSDEDYRAMLGGYSVSSSKDLSFEDAKEFVDILSKIAEKKGVYVKNGGGKARFSSMGNRDERAYPAQMRKIEAMWSDVSYMTTAEDKRSALNSFLSRRFGIDRIEWLPRNMVGKVIKSISSIKKVPHGN